MEFYYAEQPYTKRKFSEFLNHESKVGSDAIQPFVLYQLEPQGIILTLEK